MFARGLERVGLLLIPILLCPASTITAADDDFEIGIYGGATRFEQALTEDKASVGPTVGVRGSYVFSRRLAWYVDTFYSTAEAAAHRGTAGVLVGRTGLEFAFQPDREIGWFVSAGGGYSWIDYELGRDCDNAIYSAGVGQRVRINSRMHVRWEIRGDVSVSRGDHDQTLNDGKFVVGVDWGTRRSRR